MIEQLAELARAIGEECVAIHLDATVAARRLSLENLTNDIQDERSQD